MLQPYKKPELNLHAYIYQARSIRGGGGGWMHFPSQKTFSLLIMKLAPPFWGPFKIEEKKIRK